VAPDACKIVCRELGRAIKLPNPALRDLRHLRRRQGGGSEGIPLAQPLELLESHAELSEDFEKQRRADLFADGQRFLGVATRETGTAPFTLVVNWPAELDRPR